MAEIKLEQPDQALRRRQGRRGSRPRRRARLVPRAARPVGLRQDDDDEHDLRPREADERRDLLRRPSRSRSVEPGKRNVGFVFQNYAIFTHMTRVREPRVRAARAQAAALGATRSTARSRRVAETVGLSAALDRRAARLSVNDLQKVALGRSMIVRPAIFLLDEPFSNLDAAFRAYMRAELKRIQHEIGQTMVYVTHDQVEAMGMADQIAVMNLGVLQQYGTPDELYNRPANRFVANFIGSVLNNFLPARLRATERSRSRRRRRRRDVDVSDRRAAIGERADAGGRLTLSIRPERVRLVAPGLAPRRRLRAKVVARRAARREGRRPPRRTTGYDVRAVGAPGDRPRSARTSGSRSTRRRCTSSTTRPGWRCCADGQHPRREHRRSASGR